MTGPQATLGHGVVSDRQSVKNISDGVSAARYGTVWSLKATGRDEERVRGGREEVRDGRKGSLEKNGSRFTVE